MYLYSLQIKGDSKKKLIKHKDSFTRVKLNIYVAYMGNYDWA
jgi:hypothetical protein